MSETKTHPREAERLAALRSYDILDSLPEEPFDDLAALAGHVCEAPIAFVSFVDEERRWTKAQVGMKGLSTTPRSDALCNEVVASGMAFVVEDLAAEPRFADNALLSMGIRFYAGVPIMTPDGLPIGSVCVLDVSPRELGSREQFLLEALARQVEVLLAARAHAKVVRDRDVKLELLEALVHGTNEAIMLVGQDGRILEVNDAATRLYGLSRAELVARTFASLDTGARSLPNAPRVQFEAAHQNAAGRLLPVEISSAAAVQGEAYAVVIRSLAAEIDYRPTVPAPSGVIVKIKAA